MPFRKANSVQIFRTFTVHHVNNVETVIVPLSSTISKGPFNKFNNHHGLSHDIEKFCFEIVFSFVYIKFISAIL